MALTHTAEEQEESNARQGVSYSISCVGRSCVIPDLALLIWRVLVALYVAATIALHEDRNLMKPYFFTNWSYYGLLISFLLLTCASVWHKIAPSDNPVRIAKLVVVFVQVFASSSLFLDVVYWALLHDFRKVQPVYTGFQNINRHLVSMVTERILHVPRIFEHASSPADC